MRSALLPLLALCLSAGSLRAQSPAAPPARGEPKPLRLRVEFSLRHTGAVLDSASIYDAARAAMTGTGLQPDVRVASSLPAEPGLQLRVHVDVYGMGDFKVTTAANEDGRPVEKCRWFADSYVRSERHAVLSASHTIRSAIECMLREYSIVVQAAVAPSG